MATQLHLAFSIVVATPDVHQHARERKREPKRRLLGNAKKKFRCGRVNATRSVWLGLNGIIY